MRALEPDSWDDVATRFPERKVVEGTVGKRRMRKVVAALVLGLGGCSEGTPPSAPPPPDASIEVALSTDDAANQGLAEIVIEILGVTALSDGGSDVDLGAPGDGINLVDVDSFPVDLVSGEAEPGPFTGLRVQFGEEGFVSLTPGGLSQDLTVTETTVTASGSFTVEDDAVTNLELTLDLDGRLTFDEATGTWELDPRRLELLN